MEKLAVLPEYRHEGHCRNLVEFVCEYIKKTTGK
jgi:hypothetical protein